LRADTHDVTYIKEAAAGIDDATVLRMATDEERILITEDKGFWRDGCAPRIVCIRNTSLANESRQ
jgi:predicted nuclease of predicted toxin-antitoxin system